ncbi:MULTISPECIES: hypothetical protein [Enterobacterales]|uniref:hypothetical protein n=1 Tax=Enterobacterales TaxID=91347 RepID=UPI001113118D|nr:MULTISPECIES: hypothetical protein [Enterobacterales]MCK9782724.1 hypothetical protein [Proteus columbae]WOO51492.1 hypothetical protein R2S03_10140 [Hafnia alvei]WPF05965.1 hypothetical protein SB028_08990 [Proteus vulgaris]
MAVVLLYSSVLFAENKIENVVVHDKYCSSPEQTMDEVFENGALTYCAYAGLSIVDAYKKYVNEHDEDYLVKTIKVNNNIQKEYLKDSVSVDYKWENSKKLMIEQQFAGGFTELVLEEDTTGTKITITGHPD